MATTANSARLQIISLCLPLLPLMALNAIPPCEKVGGTLKLGGILFAQPLSLGLSNWHGRNDKGNIPETPPDMITYQSGKIRSIWAVTASCLGTEYRL